MGHTHLDTTMRYLAPSTTGVRSPLDALAAGNTRDFPARREAQPGKKPPKK
jgi:hypothetical protein